MSTKTIPFTGSPAAIFTSLFHGERRRKLTGARRAARADLHHRVEAAQRGARYERAHLVPLVAEALAAAVPPRLPVVHAPAADRDAEAALLDARRRRHPGRAGRLRQQDAGIVCRNNEVFISSVALQ